MRLSVPSLFVAFAFSASPHFVWAGDEKPQSVALDKDTETRIGDRIHALQAQVISLKAQGVRDPFLADVEVFLKAANWADDYKEYYSPDSGKWAVDLLDRGLLRAGLVQHDSQQVFGTRWYVEAGQPIILGYRSRIDDSVQPYVVTIPKGYGNDPKVKWRLDVVLHGRNKDGSELKFLRDHLSAAPADLPYVLLEVYGRGNNGYRWAGETDVMEAVENFLTIDRFIRRVDLIDTRRLVLRGFSMGGAGTWHMGLHRPDSWCVIGPGAGFTTTRGYVKDLPEKLPPYIERCLRIYDAVDYADNGFDVPIVAYAGDQDPQLQAALNIEARLKADGLSMTLLKAPGLKHDFPPEWRLKAETEYAKYASPGMGRKEYPDRVWFTTYTTKYSSCDWVEILGMDEHYHRAKVDATRNNDGFTVKTTNVRALKLTLPPNERDPQKILIGDEVIAKPTLYANGSYVIFLEQQAGKWVNVLPQKIANDRMRKAQKVNGLQGPIDDAFSDSFLCVRGTGAPWNPGVQKYADTELDRFTKEWGQFFRGKLLVRNDNEVTESDIANRNLILFGDPGSNSLIAQVLDGLPLKWNKEQINFDGKTFDSASHIPVMIYPSPVNLNRYVVLNSGHTFHEADFVGTNALLFPRLGDYAILKTTTGATDPQSAEVVTAGLFDDFWKLPSK